MKAELAKYIDENENINMKLGEIKFKKRIGEGGNGIVYEVEVQNLILAVKILTNTSNGKLNRFKAEYFNKMLLPPNSYLVDFINYDEICVKDKSYPLIIMRKYERSLKKHVFNDIREIKGFFKYLLDSVQFLHDNGVIHRDLKPENILINNGQFFLADFGIAKFDSKDSLEFHKTNKKERLANFDFSAPECFNTTIDITPDKRMDIYSIGQLIQWAVTGRVHKGTGRKRFIDNDILQGDRDFAILLDKVVNKCIQQDVNERFSSIKEIKEFIKREKIASSKPDPLKDMEIFQNLIHDIYPEAFKKFSKIEDEETIKNIIESISENSVNFENNAFWFTYGNGDNHIDKIKYIENNTIVLNGYELVIKNMWVRTDLDVYRDIFILEVNTNEEIEPFHVNNEDFYQAIILDNGTILNEKDVETGRFRLNGEVHKLSDYKYEFRDRSNSKRYYFLTFRTSNIFHKQSQQYIEELQLQSIDQSKLERLYQNIRRNISIELLNYL
ncbi:protein kinase domain-containing protein [Mammaliicoccus sciuri]|uniref:protein kinase domain-containing protein n=1 Tax=Mammaliicoccus sciuri TaxID=1296 RepID=UPI001FB23B73|nr:protein kinase [Mammaliicoccus sciuri]MCJ0941327.1 protein kinase [Mammaliicoccus sciuri]MCJ0965306.1 protein kinase [Mammaliicoccus sciuri]